MLAEHPLTAGVPFRFLLAGSAVGALRMAPEWIVTGTLGFVVSVLLFALLSAPVRNQDRRRHLLPLGEPFLLALAGLAGVVLEHPSVLRHPALIPLRQLSVATVSSTLFALTVLLLSALGWQQAGRRGALFTGFAAVGTVLVLWRLSVAPPTPRDQQARSKQTILLGIDSLAQTD